MQTFESYSWSLVIRLIQKIVTKFIESWIPAVLFMQTNMLGGSIETDVTDETVIALYSLFSLTLTDAYWVNITSHCFSKIILKRHVWIILSLNKKNIWLFIILSNKKWRIV